MNGTWNFFFSWGCNGFYGQTTLTLNNDGTFTTGDGGKGNWAQVGGMVNLLYSVGANPSYSGNVLGSAIVGMILTPGGDTGCWYATNQQAQAAQLQQGQRSSAG